VIKEAFAAVGAFLELKVRDNVGLAFTGAAHCRRWGSE
jgi:hypothetical protein